MQKVNVFAQLPMGKTFYRPMICPSAMSMADIMESCGLEYSESKVYLDGRLLRDYDLKKTCAELKAKNPAFLSVKHAKFRSKA